MGTEGLDTGTSRTAPGATEGVEARLRSLLETTADIVGELSLSAVLLRIVDSARELLGVEYGALGVIAPNRRGLEEFVHSGVDPEVVERIGHLPRGHGLLGALIEDPHPIRLTRLGDDVRSVGFPEHHPPMASFLGVPVRVRNEVFGNLYLCGTTPRDFTDADVEMVTGLAATAGIAIENARLFGEARRRQTWLEQTSRLTRELLGAPRADALGLVAETVLALAGGDRVSVHTPGGEDGRGLLVAVAGEVDPALNADDERLLAAWVLATGAALRSDEDGELEAVTDGEAPELGALDATGRAAAALLAVPLAGSGDPQAALVISRRGERAFSAADLEAAATFAGHVSLALEVAAQRRDRERLQLLEDRARIARDLHDHVIQQLFAAGMTVQGVMTSLGQGTEASMLDEVVDLIDEAVGQIRTSIFHLRSQPRDATGMRAGVLDAVRGVRDLLDARPHVRFGGPVDAVSDEDLVQDVRAVVREALTNIARHARASTVTVTATAEAGTLTVVVSDDGVGLGQVTRRSGLGNLEQRATRRGGRLEASAPPGGGTRLSWQVPL